MREDDTIWQSVQSHRRWAFLLSCIRGREFLSTPLSIPKADLQWLSWPTYRPWKQAGQILPGKKTAELGFYYQISEPWQVGLSLTLTPEPACWPRWRRIRAWDPHAPVGVRPPPHRSSPTACSFFSLCFHLEFERYLTQPWNRSCFFED